MFSESDAISNYHLSSKILGRGSFGTVHEAIDCRSQKKSAIKKISCLSVVTDFISLYRELSILRVLRGHPHIVTLEYVEIANLHFYLVFERADTDLDRVIRSDQPLTLDHISFFLYQIFHAVEYLHSAKIVHRDLKPSNILVNLNCHIKICDFGLARAISDSDTTSGIQQTQALSNYVVTRWYRSPEIILEYPRGGESPADIWSIGCIMAELFLRKPIFQGKNQSEVLSLIIKLLGYPQLENNPWLAGCKKQIIFKNSEQKLGQFDNIFERLGNPIMILLRQLLEFNPFTRITAEQALQHVFITKFKLDESSINRFILESLDSFDQESFMTYLQLERELSHLQLQQRESNCVTSKVRHLIENEVASYKILDKTSMTVTSDESQDSSNAFASAAASEPVASSLPPNGKGFFASAESPPKVSSSQLPAKVSPR